MLGLFEVFPIKEIAQSHKPYAMSPTANTTAAPAPSLWSRLTGVRSVPGLGLLTSSVTAGTNAAIVQRSWGLFRQEAALQAHFYGPNFTYREFMRARSLLGGVAMHYGLLLGGLLLMFCPPFRSAMRRFVYKPGQGPDRDVAARDYIEFRGVAAPDGEASGKKQATIKTHYHGSMYYSEFPGIYRVCFLCVSFSVVLVPAEQPLDDQHAESRGSISRMIFDTDD